MTDDRLVWVYGIVPASFDVRGAPSGVDDVPLEMIVHENVAALASRVSAASYDASTLDERIADLAWLAPRAEAHDRVLTWASDANAVVPLPIFSLFRSIRGVGDMLRERVAELETVLARVSRGREYGVRVFCIDDELDAALAELSPRIAAIKREAAAAASPGQRYLRTRKLDSARKEESRRVSLEVAHRAYEALAAVALEAMQHALPQSNGERGGGAVLSASFLVAHDAVDDFRAVVTSLVREYGARGFRIEFTGPWPPYHFAEARDRGE